VYIDNFIHAIVDRGHIVQTRCDDKQQQQKHQGKTGNNDKAGTIFHQLLLIGLKEKHF
jgi:hypothetical protein